MNRGGPRLAIKVAAPAILDGVCLCAFVILGRQSHDIGEGALWFFIVVWPFIAGWFAVALALGLYTARNRLRVRLATTAILGIVISLLLRATVTHRDTPLAFIIVAVGFIVLTTVGWRVVAFALSRLARR